MPSKEKPERPPDDRVPFRESLADFGGKEGIKRFESNKNKLVRVKKIFNTPEEAQKEAAYAREARAVFDDFSETTGIPVVKADPVIGERHDHPMIFEVVDRIDGDDLLRMEFGPEKAEKMADKIDDLYVKLVRYYADKYERGGKYLDDLWREQFVYGKKPGEKTERFYLVDIDPFVSEYDAERGEEAANGTLIRRLVFLSADIKSLEPQLYGHKLSRARDEFGRFFDALRPADAENDYIREAKEMLSGDSD